MNRSLDRIKMHLETDKSSGTGEIFVFGSNEAGRHGKGAAKFARLYRGAVYGQGEGLQGQSYAIPTKTGDLKVLPLVLIAAAIERFRRFAASRPDLVFEVTPVGCGHAGYHPNQIAVMFKDCPANCRLPAEFAEELGIESKSLGQRLRYAGVGSRETPAAVLDYMRRVAVRLASHGFLLRSGRAIGADSAFESGANDAGGLMEIWLPKPGSNRHSGPGKIPSKVHFTAAATTHPNWGRLSPFDQALHARNVGQVLGEDLRTPVNFVLCWTPDGAESEAARTVRTGGTATAIVVADRNGIPVINLAAPQATARLAEVVQRLIGTIPTAAEQSSSPIITSAILAARPAPPRI